MTLEVPRQLEGCGCQSLQNFEKWGADLVRGDALWLPALSGEAELPSLELYFSKEPRCMSPVILLFATGKSGP